MNIFNFYGSLYGDVNGFDDDDDNVNGLSDIDNDEDCEKENQWWRLKGQQWIRRWRSLL